MTKEIQHIIKRDGTTEVFCEDKIYQALYGAFKEVGFKENIDLESLTQKVVNKLSEVTTVEEVQDACCNVLMCSKYKNVAEAFIKYRTERSKVREERSEWAKIGIDITSGEDTESQRENSNVPRNSVTTQVEMIKRLYSKKFAMDFILPEKFKKPHITGDIHIHDLENLITKIPNCCLMHYPYMLENGFQLGNKWIEKPNTILTTMNILVQMVQVQSNLQFGGLTLQDLDIHLGQYVLSSFKKHFLSAYEEQVDLENNSEEALAYNTLKILVPASKFTSVERIFNIITSKCILQTHHLKVADIAIKRTKEETYKACKLLSYQLNTLQIRGESSPFVTISYGKSTTWEGRLLQKCILQERLDEFDRSGVQEFPKHMMIIKKGVNLNNDDPNFDMFQKAVKTSAKTCYPDFIFPDNQEKHTGGSATYMGCRSLLAPWYNEDNELQYLGRANVGVCSINLPRIALESKGDKELFYKILEERLDLAKEVMVWRYNRLITLTAKEASFSYIGGVFGMTLDPDEPVEKVFANGRGSVSIGYIGAYETALKMTGDDPVYDQDALNFQEECLSFIKSKIDQYKEETTLGFGLYGTPSESLTDRFCRLDKEKFGEVEGITDKGYYVNSFHVNTQATVDPFTKMDFESKFQPISSGGHVSFCETSNLSDNLSAYISIVRYAHGKGMMYIGVNSPWDFCKSCSWTGELELQEDTDYNYICPECGEVDENKIVKTVRLCGYLSTANKRPPVLGRIKEIRSRVKHM